MELIKNTEKAHRDTHSVLSSLGVDLEYERLKTEVCLAALRFTDRRDCPDYLYEAAGKLREYALGVNK